MNLQADHEVSPLKERKSAVIKPKLKKWTPLSPSLPYFLCGHDLTLNLEQRVSVPAMLVCLSPTAAASSPSSYRVIAEEDHKLDAKGQWAI